ncbi:tRNA 2-thiocytidine biosynthesis TtcA family protein [Eggerthia catenaformis]|uniref:tRNA 2-thiocytidine biosynthesis TtcA family protein n=1 Tax=Eggerthia catenaformis TaxID=31973 RepID=UPI003C703A53
MIKQKEVERSIIKTYRKEIWHNFIKSLKDYQLINEGDRIMVCISGGKDSFLLAKCIQELQRHGKIHFEAHYVCMDPGYNQYNRDYIEDNADDLGIPLEIFETNIFDAVSSGDFKNPCYFCARMRRGYLYKQAQSLACNKIALGHHFDDVIETTLLSMFYGSEVKTMMPKLHSENYKGIELIRPLYQVKEEAIIRWRDANNLTFINCACRFTEGCSLINDGTSKRKVIKEFIKTMRKDNPHIDHNIFVSMHNVNLDCVIKYKLRNKEMSFLDDYEKDMPPIK